MKRAKVSVYGVAALCAAVLLVAGMTRGFLPAVAASTSVTPAPGAAVNVPAIVESYSITGQSAALTATTIYTNGASDANYDLCFFVNLAASGVAPVNVNIIFTDAFGNVQTVATNATGSGFGMSTSTATGGCFGMRVKANTNVQLSTTLGSGSAPSYNLYATLKQD